VAWPIGTVSTQPQLRVRMPGGETLAWSRADLEQVREAGLKKLWNEEGV